MDLRILHVVDTRQLRGAEVFASDLIRALEGAGVHQRVCVLRDSGGEAVRYDARVHVLGSNGWTAPRVRIRPRAVLALRRLVTQWRPDVVQVHGGESLKHTIPATLGRRDPVVYRKIGQTPGDAIGTLRRAGYTELMRRTARVVSVADSIRREVIVTFRLPADRVITIPNAVDPSRMKTVRSEQETRRILGIPPTSPVILSLGALTWEKDPLSHVEIGARVLRSRPDAIHIIAGDGPLRLEVAATIQRHGLNGRTRLLAARDDAPGLLAITDVLLLASRTEGMPACAIEAGMMGVSVAAYAIAGIPDVVVDGVTGRLAPRGDVDRLASCVYELLGNPEVSRALGEAARERCLARFDIEAIAPKYLQVYEEILSS